jgi:glycosyltransferase involved in cell wall biosynthesis
MMTSDNRRKKVLIIQSVIPHYRVPVFNELAEKVDLTVLYDKGSTPADAQFEIIKVDLLRIKHLPYVHKTNILKLANKFDVVISMLSGDFLTTYILGNFKRMFKLILWGIGVSASYSARYDSMPKIADKYSKFIQKADAALFYSSYPVEKYKKSGINPEKLFVANNTVKVLPFEEVNREIILFVGSLYKEKKVFELLENYKKAFEHCPNVPKLVIVGDGEDSEEVALWVNDNNLQNKVVLTGAIYDEKELSKYFSQAIVCISPDQAGLSVLKSFGYGVPFVTHKNAITGGERFNINHGENGLLIDSFDEIADIICDCANNKIRYLEMGRSAKDFYDNNRTVDDMVEGFVEAIDFVLKN